MFEYVVYCKGREFQTFCSGPRFGTFFGNVTKVKIPSEIKLPLELQIMIGEKIRVFGLLEFWSLGFAKTTIPIYISVKCIIAIYKKLQKIMKS